VKSFNIKTYFLAMKINERIRKIRGDLSHEQFGIELSKSGYTFTKGNLWRYENDDDLKPSFAFYFAVAKIFNINLNWLITGEGNYLISDTVKNSNLIIKRKIKAVKNKKRVDSS
jgi:transcriptional regulator with XRE-family HTH domain